MKHICAIIQARFSSTRLPGKVLLPLGGTTVLRQVVDRVTRCSTIDVVMVATSIGVEDLTIVKQCASAGIRVYCGSLNDVLDRYYQAARLLCADHIVRITADCPLIDPDIIGRVIRKHVASKADYTTNTMPESFPDGLDVEVFTFRALEVAWKKAKLSSEREHVTPYLRKHSGVFRHAYLSHSVNLAHKRWTLDRPEDYRFLKLVYSHLYKKKRLFGMKDVLELLREHPEWETINGAIVRNEGYLASLKDNLRI